jgi:hypothetical protein
MDRSRPVTLLYQWKTETSSFVGENKDWAGGSLFDMKRLKNSLRLSSIKGQGFREHLCLIVPAVYNNGRFKPPNLPPGFFRFRSFPIHHVYLYVINSLAVVPLLLTFYHCKVRASMTQRVRFVLSMLIIPMQGLADTVGAS